MASLNPPLRSITLALTGASGLQYGMRLMEWVLKADIKIHFVMSPAAYWVAALETDLKLAKRPRQLQQQLCDFFNTQPEQIQVYAQNDWLAPIASGSAVTDAMVICPCTSGTLAAIANGISDNLIERAADVTLKEAKKLILVHRETPLSAIQLENMLKLARLGVVILPANPGFYQQPQTINDLIDFVVARVLDQLGIANDLSQRWGQQQTVHITEDENHAR
jgi:flavin prenyltransferase